MRGPLGEMTWNDPEALYFMDGQFKVIFDMCKQCHSSLIPVGLLYFVFQFYLNLRLATFVSHFLKI